MGKIADFSHHNSIDFSKAKDELDLAIIRVQYGSTTIDTKYKQFVAGCKQYGIPFGHYAYCRFVSINDALVEADDFHERADKDALFLVADVEEQTCKNPADIVPATQAFIDRLKSKGWKVGLYTGHAFYKQYGMKQVKADFLWIPRYAGNDIGQPTGNKPDMQCDIWQYTEKGKMAGVSGNVDLNVLNGDKPLEWFTGAAPKVTAAAGVYYISTGGYAGSALSQVHEYLFRTGHNFDCKRGADGSIVFLIGRFDTSQPNFKDCERFLRESGHAYELIAWEKAENWK